METVARDYIEALANDFKESLGARLRENKAGTLFLTTRPPAKATRQLIMRWEMIAPGRYAKYADVAGLPATLGIVNP